MRILYTGILHSLYFVVTQEDLALFFIADSEGFSKKDMRGQEQRI